MAKSIFALVLILSLVLLPNDSVLAHDRGPCSDYPIPLQNCSDETCREACIASTGKYKNGGCMNKAYCCCNFVFK
ncbi:hypothetical protein BVRB_000270 [Beta vulgaris subsp. vulgaris]|uniref:Knottin scorpion toxin-like domain-containing protein n=1 Tax=Beta vulgaris subsp. vulgaris TaxID=3555 RepID=A0A0J8B512_BETVV|nr:hypothetical protein BVRB_000270 [Beta vulgaris subsp. vulgaris]